MIDWAEFLLVAVVSLIGACVVVTVAAFGIRLYENGSVARKVDGKSGLASLTMARLLFAFCGAVALFGVYLIVPAFH